MAAGQMTLLGFEETTEISIPQNAESIFIAMLTDNGGDSTLDFTDRNGNSVNMKLISGANVPMGFTKNPKGGWPAMTITCDGNEIQVIAIYSPTS